jgi:hypothetical protein
LVWLRALDETVKILFDLLGKAKQVVAANAEVLVVQPTRGLKNTVVLG